MFTDESRYKNATQYEVKDHRGRTVKVSATPDAPKNTILGSAPTILPHATSMNRQLSGELQKQMTPCSPNQ
jgi:hypothetical protein